MFLLVVNTTTKRDPGKSFRNFMFFSATFPVIWKQFQMQPQNAECQLVCHVKVHMHKIIRVGRARWHCTDLDNKGLWVFLD